MNTNANSVSVRTTLTTPGKRMCTVRHFSGNVSLVGRGVGGFGMGGVAMVGSGTPRNVRRLPRLSTIVVKNDTNNVANVVSRTRHLLGMNNHLMMATMAVRANCAVLGRLGNHPFACRNCRVSVDHCHGTNPCRLLSPLDPVFVMSTAHVTRKRWCN